MTFPMHEVREIGRRLSTLGVLPGLGINLTSASFHAIGSLPEVQQSFIKSVRARMELSSRFASAVLVTLSMPGDVFRRILARAARTSAGVIG